MADYLWYLSLIGHFETKLQSINLNTFSLVTFRTFTVAWIALLVGWLNTKNTSYLPSLETRETWRWVETKNERDHGTISWVKIYTKLLVCWWRTSRFCKNLILRWEYICISHLCQGYLGGTFDSILMYRCFCTLRQPKVFFEKYQRNSPEHHFEIYNFVKANKDKTINSPLLETFCLDLVSLMKFFTDTMYVYEFVKLLSNAYKIRTLNHYQLGRYKVVILHNV